MRQFRLAVSRIRFGLTLAVAAGLFASGCGSGGPRMGRVSGTVTYQGEPLKAGTVTFIATDTQRPNATGTIEADGSYSLQTSVPGDGAVVGDYKVAISDLDPNDFNTEMPGMPLQIPKSAIPKQYTDAGTSGLTATVESGRNRFDFDLK